MPVIELLSAACGLALCNEAAPVPPYRIDMAHEFGRIVALRGRAGVKRYPAAAVDMPDFSGDVKQTKVYH